jgi:hypothetical protein
LCCEVSKPVEDAHLPYERWLPVPANYEHVGRIVLVERSASTESRVFVKHLHRILGRQRDGPRTTVALHDRTCRQVLYRDGTDDNLSFLIGLRFARPSYGRLADMVSRDVPGYSPQEAESGRVIGSMAFVERACRFLDRLVG